MFEMLPSVLASFRAYFRSRADLQIEILALRHQIVVLQRQTPKPKLNPADRRFWVGLSRFWPRWRSALWIVKSATVIDWHRRGFRWYWTWKIRHGRHGRPCVPKETRELIRTLSRDNIGWGAPRIHSELLKLGIEISEASVSKYMIRHRKPPSQTWRTFLKNHATQMASVDFFTVPTALFQVLFVFIVIQHDRRRLVHFNVTAHPTAEWTARQILEAFPRHRAEVFTARSRPHPESLGRTPPSNSRLHHLRRFYYDTAGTTNPIQMQGLKSLVGISQIVFGSDFPFGPITNIVEGLRNAGLSARIKRRQLFASGKIPHHQYPTGFPNRRVTTRSTTHTIWN